MRLPCSSGTTFVGSAPAGPTSVMLWLFRLASAICWLNRTTRGSRPEMPLASATGVLLWIAGGWLLSWACEVTESAPG